MDTGIWTKSDGDNRPTMEYASSNYMGQYMQSNVKIKQEICEPELSPPGTEMNIKQEVCHPGSHSQCVEIEVDLSCVKQEFFDDREYKKDKPIINTEEPLRAKEEYKPVEPITPPVLKKNQDPVIKKKAEDEKLVVSNSDPCTINTTSLERLKNPIVPIETRKLRAYTCDHCKMTIYGKTRLKKHIVQVHGTGTHKCEECKKVYKCQSYLRQHIQTVHKSDGQNHFCTLCQKVFKNRKNFYDHNYIAHTVIEYKCNVCERIFKQKGNLEYHVATVHGNEHHECKICKKVFKAKHSLNQHVRNHHSSVQHECPICHRSFKQRQTLSHHKSTVHANGEHKCDICGKVFVSRIYLKSHIRTAHTNRGPDKQKFNCKICFKEYKWKTSLRVHQKTSKCAKVKMDMEKAAANATNVETKQPENFVTVKLEPVDGYTDC